MYYHSFLLNKLDLVGQVCIDMEGVEVLLNLPLAIPGALPAVKLLSIKSPLAIDLLIVASPGGSPGTRELLAGVHIRVV